jgi:hypothetical protein
MPLDSHAVPDPMANCVTQADGADRGQRRVVDLRTGQMACEREDASCTPVADVERSADANSSSAT